MRRLPGERPLSVEPGVTALSGADGRQRSPSPSPELATFVLIEPAPHSRILSGHERPLEALVADRTRHAHRLRACRLHGDVPRGSHRKNSSGILPDAGRTRDPGRLVRVVPEPSFNHATPIGAVGGRRMGRRVSYGQERASVVSERRFSQEGGRLVVAHRGDSAHEAENTIPAFESAIAAGADVVEFDVRMTADDVAVVMHDPDVSRTTDGAGLVRDLHLVEIKRLRIRTTDGATPRSRPSRKRKDLFADESVVGVRKFGDVLDQHELRLELGHKLHKPPVEVVPLVAEEPLLARNVLRETLARRPANEAVKLLRCEAEGIPHGLGPNGLDIGTECLRVRMVQPVRREALGVIVESKKRLEAGSLEATRDPAATGEQVYERELGHLRLASLVSGSAAHVP